MESGGQGDTGQKGQDDRDFQVTSCQEPLHPRGDAQLTEVGHGLLSTEQKCGMAAEDLSQKQDGVA